jgi:hypothetical protein
MKKPQAAKTLTLGEWQQAIEDETGAHGPRNPEPKRGTAEKYQEERDP